MVAVVEPGARHSFLQVALFEEFLIQGIQRLILQGTGLIYQTVRDVRDQLGGAGFRERAVDFKSLRRLSAAVRGEATLPWNPFPAVADRALAGARGIRTATLPGWCGERWSA